MKLSIVIPVYNTRDYLTACLDSVIDPALTDYEIIVVNDGSTDDSAVFAAEYAARYPELIRVITTENGGLGAARNIGLEAAKGDFLLFLDSDDTLAPGALREMLQELTPERDIVIFDLVSVLPDGSVIETLSGCGKSGAVSLPDYPRLLLDYPSACNKLFRRRLFLDSGVRFPGRVWYEDLRTAPKLYLRTGHIWATGRPWYRYTMRPGSITNSAKLSRNLEIIDAVDDLCDAYRQAGQAEAYRTELEYVAFYNLFLAASVRVCTVDPKSELLETLRTAFLARFPDYRKNPYIQSMPRRHKLLTELLLGGHGGAVAALMKLNDRRKRRKR